MKYTLILITLSASAFAADFTLAIGSTAAASIPWNENPPAGPLAKAMKVKDAAFAVRAENCADPEKAKITGTAEGLVNGGRQSVALHLIAGSAAGAYLVSREWPAQGVWVVNLTGVCAGAKAGALVPIGPDGYLRESSKFFPRSSTEAEIEASLKSLAGGAK
jgi:hypothetical protein